MDRHENGRCGLLAGLPWDIAAHDPEFKWLAAHDPEFKLVEHRTKNKKKNNKKKKR